jgi:RNA polymerase sigma factor (sigma-70 family)
MASSYASAVIQYLRGIVLRSDIAGMNDGQLLSRYIDGGDEDAFAALLKRHAPMVWGVCRRLLPNHQDAEDAFQATFLVLVRKAATVVPREMVANWLYGVAYMTAHRAKVATARRHRREKPFVEMSEPALDKSDVWADLRLLLDQELSRLPAKYRAVVIFCDLEGKTRQQVAGQLGLPEGTVASRLARARSMLAKRLAGYGFALSGGVLAGVLGEKAALAGVPDSSVASTIKAASLFAAGRAATTEEISVKVAALAEGILKTMLLSKLKVATAVLLVVGALTISVGTLLVPSAVGTAAGGDKDKEIHGADSVKAGESREVQIRITGPLGMKVFVLPAAGQGKGGVPIETPGRLNLGQGKRYRLKLTDIPNRPGDEKFPIVEIPKLDETTEPFLSTNAIPIEFTDEDFDHATQGEAITKVVYLKTRTKGPGPRGRQGGLATIASYNLEPDREVIEEAKLQGAILAVVRMGNIFLGRAEPEKDKRKEAHEKEAAKQPKEEKTKSVWTLDFRYKSLRLVTMNSPRQGQGRRNVWYCWYQVSNPTDEAHTFIPDFELEVGGQVYRDTVLPGAQEAIRRIEDPTQFYDMNNSVTISNKPIPPSKNAADEKKSVIGLALWEGIDPDAKSMTLFVSGLSNDWSSDGDTVRRKTLKLSFKRVDNEMLLSGPAEWVYRTIKLREEDNKNDQQTEIERKSSTKNWQVVAIDGIGTMAYINLGSSDGITPKMTFRVRSRSLDSKPNPAKGTLEVVRVIGPHLSQAQVTSLKTSTTDPIRKGDQLFNPTWNSGKNSEGMSETAKAKEAQDRLLSTYESELTARRFALELDKNRLKSLQRQLEAEREKATERENELRKTVNKLRDQNTVLRVELASERTVTARQQQAMEELARQLKNPADMKSTIKREQTENQPKNKSEQKRASGDKLDQVLGRLERLEKRLEAQEAAVKKLREQTNKPIKP